MTLAKVTKTTFYTGGRPRRGNKLTPLLTVIHQGEKCWASANDPHRPYMNLVDIHPRITHRVSRLTGADGGRGERRGPREAGTVQG